MPSPDAGSIDIPVEIFGGRVTQFDPQKLPQGASPFNQDVIYPAGAVGTRPGLQNFYPAFAGNPTVNYLRTFVDSLENLRQLNLDGLGNLRQEFPQGTLSIIGNVVAASFAQSDTYAGREWLAIGDGQFGIDIPRQWDGTHFDRVSQAGPGGGPMVTDFLPMAMAIDTAGTGTVTNIVASPTGEVGSDPQFFPPPPPFQGGPQPPPSDGFTLDTTVTITTTVPHGLVTGATIIISGNTGTGAVNGTVSVSQIISPTVFKFIFSSPENSIAAGGGTITMGSPTGTTILRSNNVVTAFTPTAHGFQPGWSVIVSGISPVAVGGATTATQQGGGVTATTATAHGLVVGATAIIAGMVDATYDGTFVVLTVPTSTSFTYAALTTTASTSGGTTSSPFDGTFTIVSVPTATSFIYANLGPNVTSASVGAATIVGNISPGLHNVSVAFVTESEYITVPSVPVPFIAGGGKLLSLTQIPIGPPNVLQRILLFTPVITPPATAGPFFFIEPGLGGGGSSTIINDNITTAGVFDFLDSTLENATSGTLLFNLLELGECSGTINYSERTFWIGERNKVNSSGGGGGFNNLEFDGGFSNPGTLPNFPLGWTLDPAFSSGGASALAQGQAAYWGDAYMIVGNGATATRGKISQTAATDYLGISVLEANTGYSIRARIRIGGGLIQGTIHINLQSTLGGFTTAGIALSAAQLTHNYVEYTAVLLTPQVTIPTDLVLQVYADGTPTQNGFFLVDCIEPYPTQLPVNRSVVRCSFSSDPESFDSETGLMIVGKDNGQAMRAMFRLLDSKLYLVKERSLYVTNDDNANEPDLWVISTVSDTVGTPSVHGVAVGEAWAVIASHDGLYIFWGADPVKISQEIQPDWDTINWAAGQNIYVVVDTANKRIHVGAPTGASTVPNTEFVLDYSQLNTAQEIADHPQAYYSTYQPTKVIAPGRARKWSIWNLLGGQGANSAALTLRNDGSYHLLRGNASGTGKIYDQLTVQLSDDGIAIDSMYQTYFAPEAEQEIALQLGSHRKLFKYLTGYAWGAGTMFYTIVGPQGQRALSLSNLTLSNPAHWEFEKNVNFVGERASLIFGTNAVGSWFLLSKLCPAVQREIMTPVRGVA